ncbi:hypothetical protein H2203_005377 [Taxawa tesnikishii (nom. ined.)]|nr:hypothetical protein H2203_005377 [Dothideales sp. JES 119]
MNLAATVRPHVASPVAAFDLPFPPTNEYLDYTDQSSQPSLVQTTHQQYFSVRPCSDDPEKTKDAALSNKRKNPPANRQWCLIIVGIFVACWKSRKVRLSSPERPREKQHQVSTSVKKWEIEGCDFFGTLYYATPCFTQAPSPTMIDVIVPDQTQWPADLRAVLGARESAHMRDGESIRSLGISSHLTEALAHWSSQDPNFDSKYTQLPFGSSVKVHDIKSDIKSMLITMEPNMRGAENMLSRDELSRIWRESYGKAIDMPPAIAVNQLEFRKRLGYRVALVHLTGAHRRKEPVVFKARTEAPGNLYHELKVLLTMPSHPGVIGRPLYIVTLADRGNVVCGFILEYYPLGTFENYLPIKAQHGDIKQLTKLRWCREITVALMHVQSAGRFHSDLKMDNVLLHYRNGQDSAMLFDFEQGRNLFSWAPPEIYLLEWLWELSTSTRLPIGKRREFEALLDRYLRSRNFANPPPGAKGPYTNPDQGYYFPWTSSTTEEREKGMVFMLGKVIWCIFEGVGEIGNVLGRSIRRPSNREFPDFQDTPESVHDLIRKCTAGAREWNRGKFGLFRVGGQVFPRGKTGLNGEPKATLDETMRAIRDTWSEEIVEIRAFVNARMRLDEGLASPKDKQYLGYLDRPTLSEVLQTLDDLEQKLY